VTVVVEEAVRKYIAENILFNKNGFPYPDDASFLENGIIDSMNVLELVMFAEENFGISVSDEDVLPENFDSVSRLSAYVRRKSLSL
jgi:acyl carrier protein